MSRVLIELLGQNQASRSINEVVRDLQRMEQAAAQAGRASAQAVSGRAAVVGGRFGGTTPFDAVPDLTSFEQSIGSLNSVLSGTGQQGQVAAAGVGAFGAEALLAASAAAGVVTFAGKLAIELGNAGQAVQQTENKFKAFSGGAGAARANLEAMQRATDNGISAQKAMTNASMLLSMGLAQSGDEAAKMVRQATMLGPTYWSAEQRLNSFTLLLQNQSVKRLGEFGLSIEGVKTKTEELMAADAGLSKEQAFTNAVLELGDQKLVKLEAAGVKAATGIDQLTASWEDLRAEIEKELAGPVGGIESNLAKPLRGVVDQMRRGAAYRDDPLAALRADLTTARDREVGNLSSLMGRAPLPGESNELHAQRIEETAAAIRKLNAEIARLGSASNIDAVVATARQLPDTLAGAETAAQGVDVAFQNGNDDLSVMGGRIIDNTVWLSEFKAMADQTAGSVERMARIFGSGAFQVSWNLNNIIPESDLQRFENQTWADQDAINARLTNTPDARMTQAGIVVAQSRGQFTGDSAYDWEYGGALHELWGPVIDVGVSAREAEKRADEQAAKEAEREWKSAAKAVESEWKSALGNVPGLLGTSAVTEGDMTLAKAGMYQPKADEYLRRLRDEVKQNKDLYPDVSIEDAAKRVGMAGAPPQAALAEFERQWGTSELFANPDNLNLIDWGAVERSRGQQAAAKQGQANIFSRAGINEEAVASLNALGVLSSKLNQQGSGGAAKGAAGAAADTSLLKDVMGNLDKELLAQTDAIKGQGGTFWTTFETGLIDKAKQSNALWTAVQTMVTTALLNAIPK